MVNKKKYFCRMPNKFIPAYLLTFVNVLGFSILIPILPFVVDSYEAPKWVFGLLLTLYSAFQFVGAPLLGGLSDSIGRKKILLVSQGGTLLSWIIFAIALSIPNFSLWGVAVPIVIIGLSRVLDGITGGNVSVTNAYISDITTKQEKSYIFGYLGGIAGLGMIIGPALGGLAGSKSLGFLGTIFVSIFVSTVALMIIFFWLKESLPEEERTVRTKKSLWNLLYIPGRIKRVNPSEVIKSIFSIKLLFSAMMAFYIGTISLYLIDLFDFNTRELGVFLFVVGAFLSFNQAFLSKRFVSRFGEFRTLFIGLFLCVFGVVAISFTRNLYLFVGFYYVLNLGFSLCFPTFNALISQHANPKKQGEIMGISEAINSFAMALFPVVGATLYTVFGYSLYVFIAILPASALIVALVKLRQFAQVSRVKE